jgi:hypothetical protein
MDRATTSYSQNMDKIDAVILDLNKAYEYDKGRARNQFTVGLWSKLLSPDDLFGAFIRKWKTKGQLHPGYIEAISPQRHREHKGRGQIPLITFHQSPFTFLPPFA